MDYKALRKRALIFDFVAILVAGAVLLSSRSLDVPQWLLVVGAVVSVVFLVLAMKNSFAARKAERAEALKYMEQQADAANNMADGDDDQNEQA